MCFPYPFLKGRWGTISGVLWLSFSVMALSVRAEWSWAKPNEASAWVMECANIASNGGILALQNYVKDAFIQRPLGAVQVNLGDQGYKFFCFKTASTDDTSLNSFLMALSPLFPSDVTEQEATLQQVCAVSDRLSYDSPVQAWSVLPNFWDTSNTQEEPYAVLSEDSWVQAQDFSFFLEGEQSSVVLVKNKMSPAEGITCPECIPLKHFCESVLFKAAHTLHLH